MRRAVIIGVPGLLILLLAVTTFTQVSCMKENGFIGTYVGGDTSAFAPPINFGPFVLDTISIAAGSGNNSVIISQSPEKSLVLSATVNGNNLTIPSQTAMMHGAPVQWTGAGTLTGNKLNLIFSYNTSPDTTYTFIGTKL